MDNRDWQVQHSREMADDRYFDKLGEKETDYEDMTVCQRCKAGYDVFGSQCDSVDCEDFQCSYFENDCVDLLTGQPCDATDICYTYKKVYGAK